MAVIKRIVILANSIKNSGRCVAGKELVFNRGSWEVGNWVRIVATEEGAEVPVPLMFAQFGRQPNLLETIDIPLESHVPLADQPENWLLVRNAKWTNRGTLPPNKLQRLLDYPLKLWGVQTRSVPEGFVQNMAEPASLYFIEPELLDPVRVWLEDGVNEEGHKNRCCRRICLRYRRTFHEFNVTDPVLLETCFPIMPKRGDPILSVPIPSNGPVYVCISLTPVFRGKHYKIAAGFVLPKDSTAE